MISKLVFFVASLLSLLSCCERLMSQAVGEAPRSEYYMALELYETGRLVDASEGFKQTLSRSMRIRERAWVDSIPPLVMLGESYFHVGKVALAMEQYDAALAVALDYPNWIEQVVAPLELQPYESKSKGINWFAPSRPTQSTRTPERGQLTVDVVGQPGVGQPIAFSTRVDSAEVLRTMGLAIVRRGEVLGPLAKHSPLASRLSELLGRDVQQRAEWVKSSWRLLRGLHALSVPSEANPSELILANAFIGKGVDYYMTPLALLHLGKHQWKQKDIVAALPYWQDGSLIAARYDQYSMLAETLQTISAACTAGNRTDLLTAVQNASAWGVKRSATVQAAGHAGAAELATMAGDWAAAEANSKQAAAALRIREVTLPRVQAQLFFANAITAFGEYRGILGQQSLESALKIMRGTAQDGAMAKQIFQSQLVLNLLQSNQLQAVDAEALLTEILQEPGVEQWQAYPLETIAAMTTSAVPAYATWLDLAERRGTKEQIVERMDRIHRQRLYEALPMGGRLFSLRAAILGEKAQLPANAQTSAAQMMQASPELAKSTQRIATLLAPIATSPLPLEERNVSAEIRKNFTELGKAVDQNESLLYLQALKRKPFDRFIPFSATVSNVQAALDEDDLTLGFVCSGGRLYGTAITKNALETWSTTDLPQIEEHVKLLLGEIGLATPSKVTPSQVTAANAAWRETVVKLYGKLLPSNIQTMVAAAERIVVVPDGALWYLPFEMLPASSKSLNSNWLAKHPVVYLPTLGSLPLINTSAPKIDRTLHAAAAFFSQDKSSNETLSEKLVSGILDSQRLELGNKNHSPFVHWSPLMVNQFIVTGKVVPAQPILETSFLPIDGTRSAQLGAWIETPCRTPARLLLPGYQSAATTKDLSDGRELFIPACSMLYNGTRTVFVSRWAVGGRCSQVVLSRFLQELDRESPSVAWQRAAIAIWADDFLIADEPALLPSGKESEPLVSGQHPKLWSGYMVIGDSQSPPPQVP